MSSEMPAEEDLEEPPPALTLRTNWTVELQLSLPTDMTCRIHPSLYNKVDELLEGRGPVYRLAPDSVQVLFGVEAKSAAQALEEANHLVPPILELLDPGQETMPSISISEHVDAPMEFVGMGEVATIMGVSKQRIYQLAERKDFPEPAFRLKATPVWRTADIYRFRRLR